MYLKLKSALAFFRTRLGARLMVMFIGVALLPLLVGGLMSYRRVRTSLINLALSKVEQEAALTAKDLGTYLEQFSTDLLMLSSAPPVQGLLRAQDNDGLDPATGRSYEEWIDWLRQLFATTMQSKKFYQQLRYLNVNGQEIVRIEYRDGAITVVWSRIGQDSTQFLFENRVNASYFTLAQQLQPGEVAVSPLILSPEEEAENQLVPIIYFSTPIYDRADQFRGVVVSTVYAASFLNRLSVNRGQLYMSDQTGFYLAHPDPTRTFGTEREAGYNVAADFSNTYQTLLNSDDDAYTALDEQRTEVVALHKFYFDPLHLEQYWLLIRTLPQDEVLGQVKTLGALAVGVALLVTVAVALLAYRLAGSFTRPIVRLTQVAEQISQKELPQLVDSLGRVAAGEMATQFDLSVEPVEVRSEDEIGQLETAFNKMAVSLCEAYPRLLKMQEQLRLQKEVAEAAQGAAEAANQAKSTFLASMSHELRTPLNAILGYADILQRRTGYSGPLVDGLDIIHQSGEHLLTLINDVLDLAKIEAGKLDLTPAPVHLPTFLRQIVGIVRARAEAKDLALTYEPLSPLPATVLADETRLRQVLLNLLGNAVKFTERGHVALTVEVLDEIETGAAEVALRFRVEDTGVGIAPEQLERIFQPFEQAGEADKRTEGAGLGLAISQQIVQMMGGRLHVESEVGQGSVFWFDVTLPLTEVVAREEPTPARDIVGYEGPRRMVLVADDKQYNRLLLVDMLEPLGFEVHSANDGQQAVDRALELRPDAIVMDLIMPVKTGFEAVQEMRQQPALRDVAIIAASASVLEADREKSLVAGCDAFLPKPIRTEHLLDLLATHLGLSWVYAAPAVETAALAGPVVPPPAEELAALRQLARLGQILDIREHALRLAEMDAAYVPFSDRLQELTTSLEIDQIVAFVEQFIEAGLVPPPQDELAVLHHLALQGDMYGIRERVAHIETLGEPYVPFARKLSELAKGFEEGQILTLVEQHMEGDK